MSKISRFMCPVCGYEGEEFWDNTGTATFAICPCCSTESGYYYQPEHSWDEQISYIKEHRQAWMEKGGNWFSPEKKPEKWDLQKQLLGLPEKFRS